MIFSLQGFPTELICHPQAITCSLMPSSAIWLLPCPISLPHVYHCFLGPPPKYTTGTESKSGTLLADGQPEAPTFPSSSLQHEVLQTMPRAVLFPTSASQPTETCLQNPTGVFTFFHICWLSTVSSGTPASEVLLQPPNLKSQHHLPCLRGLAQFSRSSHPLRP